MVSDLPDQTGFDDDFPANVEAERVILMLFITVPKRASGSRSGRAHTVYYERKFGKMPIGMLPDHLCRVHSCVNPDHIEPVTPAINTRRGLSAKLNEGQVAQIKCAIRSGQLQESIAGQFGVTQTMVSRIKLEKAWRGVA